MIEAFFRTGNKRRHQSRPRDYSRTGDGKWYGDCITCHKTFIYQNIVFINPFPNRVGGFCYRCEKEYCDIHVGWEKSTINNPNTGTPYDGFNAMCPTCNILLNSHHPQLVYVDEIRNTKPLEGMKVLKRIIELLRERDGDENEIKRLEGLQVQFQRLLNL